MAVEIADREGLDAEQRLVLMLAVLCHDFGEAETTVQNGENRWISSDHSDRGATLSEAFLLEMKAPGWVVEIVKPLVRPHMAMLAIPEREAPSPRVVRRLATRLSSATIRLCGRRSGPARPAR